jgi:hypothetical protein
MKNTLLFALMIFAGTHAFAYTDQKDIASCFGIFNAHINAGGQMSTGNQRLIDKNADFYNKKVKIIAKKVLDCRGSDTSSANHKACAESLSAPDLEIYRAYNSGVNQYLGIKQQGDSTKLGVILLACSA